MPPKLPEEERKRRRREANRLWAQKNPDKLKINLYRWIDTHREEWNMRCKPQNDKYRARKRQDPEWVKNTAEYMRNYRKANAERLNALQRERYQKRKEEKQNAS